jgi:hypothetical protein
MSEKVRVPKVMDRVAAIGHNTVYAVISVNADAKNVNLKLVGQDGPVLKDVPWGALQYIEEEDFSQAAFRAVKEATDKV